MSKLDKIQKQYVTALYDREIAAAHYVNTIKKVNDVYEKFIQEVNKKINMVKE